MPERHVGELLIRGTSVTPGYYKRPDATAALFHDGWLCTGDLAYLLDGELVLCGRIKDVIIVGGRNVFPEDIERAVGALDGVRAGNVIAFGDGGLQGQGERRRRGRGPRGGRSRRASAHAIHHRTLEVCGLPPRDVMLVQPGTLPKTSSGKLQRAKCREQYLDEELELVTLARDPRLRLGPSPAARPRARDRGVRRCSRRSSTPAGPRRSAPRSPPTTAFDDRRAAGRPARRRSRPSTTRASCASSRRRGRSTSARSRPTHDVVPDVFAMPGLRAGMGAAARAGAGRAPGSGGGASRRRRR